MMNFSGHPCALTAPGGLHVSSFNYTSRCSVSVCECSYFVSVLLMTGCMRSHAFIHARQVF